MRNKHKNNEIILEMSIYSILLEMSKIGENHMHRAGSHVAYLKGKQTLTFLFKVYTEVMSRRWECKRLQGEVSQKIQCLSLYLLICIYLRKKLY